MMVPLFTVQEFIDFGGTAEGPFCYLIVKAHETRKGLIAMGYWSECIISTDDTGFRTLSFNTVLVAKIPRMSLRPYAERLSVVSRED